MNLSLSCLVTFEKKLTIKKKKRRRQATEVACHFFSFFFLLFSFSTFSRYWFPKEKKNGFFEGGFFFFVGKKIFFEFVFIFLGKDSLSANKKGRGKGWVNDFAFFWYQLWMCGQGE